MSLKDIFEKDKSVFKDFDFEMWNRYYRAINAETPVEKVKDKPYFLKLTENEKECYLREMKSLQEDRKTFPQAAYEVRLKDFD